MTPKEEQERIDRKTWHDIMKEYKPNITEVEATNILWNYTCFPFSDKITREQIKEYFEKTTPST